MAIARTLDLARLVRPDFAALPAYPAPESASDLAAELGIPLERLVKLDQNENPHGCSPKVREALARFDRYNIYPDILATEVRALLTDYVGAPADQIIVGNGSDELVDLLLRVLVLPGDKVITWGPTFSYYAGAVAVCGAQYVDIPRGRDFEIDVDKALAVADERTKLFILCNPNNPSANLTPVADIRRLLDTGLMVLLDEAYAEFSGTASTALMAEYENLAILRTFSKWAGLAGLRIGYGLFPRALVPLLLKVKPPFNVNVAAQEAAKASLHDLDYLRHTVGLIVAERERLLEVLPKLPVFSKVYPSRTNFILCEVTGGNGRSLRNRLAKKGILLRHFDNPALRRFIRITVGTREQDDVLLSALEEESNA